MRRISWQSLLNAMEIASFPQDHGIRTTACPFHDGPTEQTLNLIPDGKFHCWRCSATGDIFQYVLRAKYKNTKDPAPVLAFFERSFHIPSCSSRPDLYSE